VFMPTFRSKEFKSTLQDVVETIFLGMPTPKSSATAASADTFKVINIRDIKDDFLVDPSEFSTIDLALGSNPDRFRVKEGDVLITARSAIRVAAVHKKHAGAIAAANLIVVRPSDRLASSLVFGFLANDATKRKLTQLQTGTTVSSLNVKAVSALKVRIPSVDEQADLVALATVSREAYSALTAAAETRRRITQDILLRALEVR
jgi:hypothetical protein